MWGMSKCKKCKASSTSNKSSKTVAITTKRLITATQSSSLSRSATTLAKESIISSRLWTTRRNRRSRGKRNRPNQAAIMTPTWTSFFNWLPKRRSLYRSSHRPYKKIVISSGRNGSQQWFRTIQLFKITWHRCARWSNKMNSKCRIMSISLKR